RSLRDIVDGGEPTLAFVGTKRGEDAPMSSMRRRQFITLLGGAAAAWPLAARAQQRERMRLIGGLMNLAESDRGGQAGIAAFREGLGKLGWTEGREVQIEYRWFAGDPERAQAYAADLVKLKPEVIFAGTAPSLAPLQRETRSVPIVFAQVADPVAGASLPVWHGRAAISPVLLNSSMRSVRSGWNCSSRSPPRLLARPSFTTRRIPKRANTCPPSRLRPNHLAYRCPSLRCAASPKSSVQSSNSRESPTAGSSRCRARSWRCIATSLFRWQCGTAFPTFMLTVTTRSGVDLRPTASTTSSFTGAPRLTSIASSGAKSLTICRFSRPPNSSSSSISRLPRRWASTRPSRCSRAPTR